MSDSHADTIRHQSAILADWAEAEGGFPSVQVDDVRADLIAALDALVAELEASEKSRREYIEETIRLREENGMLVADLAEARAGSHIAHESLDKVMDERDAALDRETGLSDALDSMRAALAEARRATWTQELRDLEDLALAWIDDDAHNPALAAYKSRNRATILLARVRAALAAGTEEKT